MTNSAILEIKDVLILGSVFPITGAGVAAISHYWRGFQITPLAGLVSGAISSGLLLAIIYVSSKTFETETAVLLGFASSFIFTPLISGVFGFPVLYWEFLSQFIMQVVVSLVLVAVPYLL